MKQRKIAGIIIFVVVLLFAMGVSAYAVGVTNETELRNTLADASTDAENPTKIELLNNIDITQSFGVTGTSSAKKYVEISGPYTIKLATTKSYYPEAGGNYRGVMVVENAEVVLKDVTIDANYGGTSYANCLFVGTGATVTMKGTATLANGGKFGSSKGSALGVNGGTFIMEDNSKITGASCSAGSGASGQNASVIYLWNNAKFVMNGGEISGNTAGSAGIIYASASNTSEIMLNGGKIADNTFKHSSVPNYAVYYTTTATATGAKLYISGDMQIEGLVYNGVSTTKITSALKNDLTLAYYYGLNNSNKYMTLEGADGYTLTMNDINKIKSQGGNTADYKLYLYPETNSINRIEKDKVIPDGGVEQGGTLPPEITTYIVTFKGYGDVTLKTEEVEEGGSATAPSAPEVTDRIFIGWDNVFDNITSNLIVTAQYVEKIDPITGAIRVSDAGELTSALADLSTDAENPTKIELVKNIDISASLNITGTSSAKKYVEISGPYTIKLAINKSYYPEAGGDNRGVMVVENAEVILKDVAIDANYGGTSYANCMYVGAGATVTMKGTATLANGGKFGSSKGSALGVRGGTFIMGDNSKITGSSCSAGSGASGQNASVIYLWDNAKFVMNGGEISGNTAGSAGIIYASASNTSEIMLNSGKIANNTFKHSSSPNYAVYYTTTATATGAKLYISGDMQIEGLVYNGVSTTKITSALKNDLTLAYYYGLNNSNKYMTLEGADGYTLTMNDINKIKSQGGNTADYKLYLYPETNSINIIEKDKVIPDGGVEQGGTLPAEPEFPTDITGVYDAENAIWTLGNGEKITISTGAVLKNATIDATNGKIVMGTTEITGGTVVFNDNGEIDVADNSSIKLVQSVYNISWEENGETKNANSDNGTEAVGFMTRTDFEEGAAATKYIMNIEAIHNGTTKNGTVEIPTPGIYAGSVRLLFSFVNVPSDAVVNVTGGNFQ